MNCFVDRSWRATPAEEDAWRLYLGMPQRVWEAARHMFREVHDGMAPDDALMRFVMITGYDHQKTLDELRAVLT